MDLLHSLDTRLRAVGIPVDEWARPGLSAESIETALARLELRPPAEAYIWWGWHDGTTHQGIGKAFAPGAACLSLAEAIHTCLEFRALAKELVDPDVPALADADARWDKAWVPIRGRQHPIVIDCGVVPGTPSPVRFIDLQNVAGSPVPKARSLGEMVCWWLEAIDSGAWRWDATADEWVIDQRLLREMFRNNQLV